MKPSPKISTFSTKEIDPDYERLLDNFEQTICIICGQEVDSYWEPKYKGLRASCSNCEINWAES